MARLRLGISGLGRGATLTVPGLATHPRIEIAGGFDPSAESRQGFARLYDAKTHDSFEDLIADPDIDAVYIASPHEHHAAQAIAAARAGKHILVEKPMAVSVAEARAMTAAAADSDVRLMIGPSHGYDAPVEFASALVASGDVGRPRMINTFNYTDFLFRPRRPEELDRDRGGGVVFSQATHQIDIVRRLADSGLRSVRACVFDWDPERRADGAYAATLFFQGGAVAMLGYSGYAHYDSDALHNWVGELGFSKTPETHARARSLLAKTDEGQAKSGRGFGGSNKSSEPAPESHEHFGFVIVSCENADIEITPHGIVVHGDEGRDEIPVPPPDVRRAGVADAFAAHVLDDTPTPFDGEWGLHTLACCEAMLRSSDEDREIAIAEILSESD